MVLLPSPSQSDDGQMSAGPSGRPSIHRLSLCLTPVTFSVCAFSLLSSVRFNNVFSCSSLHPPRVSASFPCVGVWGAWGCLVGKLPCNCMREITVRRSCFPVRIPGAAVGWKLERLKLFHLLCCRLGSLAVRMLSTGKTACCVWAPLALLALLSLSFTQAQAQGKSLSSTLFS